MKKILCVLMTLCVLCGCSIGKESDGELCKEAEELCVKTYEEVKDDLFVDYYIKGGTYNKEGEVIFECSFLLNPAINNKDHPNYIKTRCVGYLYQEKESLGKELTELFKKSKNKAHTYIYVYDGNYVFSTIVDGELED